MELKVTDDSPIRRTVEVTVPATAVKGEIARRLKEIGKRVRVPGFRRGHVPMAQLRKRYGKDVRFEAIDALVRSHIGKALETDDLKGTVHVAQPELTDMGEGESGFAFSFVAERLPKVEPKDYDGVAVQQKKVEVTDEDVRTELDQLQEQHTDLVPVEDREEVAADDIVVVSYKGVGEGPAAEIHADDQTIDLADENLLDGFASGLTGAKKGEAAEVSVTLPEDFQLDELAGQTITLEVTVAELKRRDVPAIDDELAKQSGEAETLDELKAAIRERIDSSRRAEAEMDAKRRLVAAVREANDVEIPEGYLEDQARNEVRYRLQQMQQQGMDLSVLGDQAGNLTESVKPQVRNAVLESLVLRSIAEAENIEVDEDAINAWIDEQAEATKQPKAKLRARYRNAEARNALSSRLLFDRVLEFIWSKARIEEVDELPEAETAEEADAE